LRFFPEATGSNGTVPTPAGVLYCHDTVLPHLRLPDGQKRTSSSIIKLPPAKFFDVSGRLPIDRRHFGAFVTR